ERQTIHNALIDREIKLTRREVNILMRSLKRKYPDKAIDANDAVHEPFELPFETHEANLLQFPSNDQAVHDILILQDAQNGLFLADLGLAKLQTHTLLRLLADLKCALQDLQLSALQKSDFRQIEQQAKETYCRMELKLKNNGKTIVGIINRNEK
ncbi:MAG: hypothetical protein EZS28_043691, partial [Streblomastix strix]